MSERPPFGDLLGKLGGLKAKVDEAMKAAASRTASATVGGGMVTATANGKQEIVRVKIEKSALDTNDVGMIEDLVAAACNQALQQTKSFSQEELQRLVGQFGLALPPGFDISKFFPGT